MSHIEQRKREQTEGDRYESKFQVHMHSFGLATLFFEKKKKVVSLQVMNHLI